jgi:glycosyltransferase involved in cell wall biosynthesis
MKLVILTNILTPYRIPLFEEIQREIPNLTVVLMAASEENRQWGDHSFNFKTIVLPGIHLRPPGHEVSIHFNYGVFKLLKRLDPDMVLSGGFFAPANIMALLYCKLYRKKVIGWGEVTLRNPNEHSLHKRLIRKIMTRLSDSLIASSSEAHDTFIYYGGKKERILTTVMPIHVDQFKVRADKFRTSPECQMLKRRFSSPILLSVGRMIDNKGYKELFNIYEEVIRVMPETSLILAGDGPERGTYEVIIRERNLKNVHFTGFLKMDELIKYYVISDLFVFPTLLDTFGAVICEAMACETPVVSSIFAAGTRDLVFDQYNGYRCDPRDIRSSSEIILNFLKLDGRQKREMGIGGYLTVKQFDIQNSARSMAQFMNSVLLSPSP